MIGFEPFKAFKASSILEALDQSLARAQFDPDGRIVGANATFCRVMGYDPAEIIGRPHSLLVDPEEASGPNYAAFWANLRRGVCDARRYRRIGKGGRVVWLTASYNPIKNSRGVVVGIVEQATDTTAETLIGVETSAKVDAIERVQAVIEFDVDGLVLRANDTFLTSVGYRLDEIVGRHHRIFVAPAYAASEDYRTFWQTLRSGNAVAAEFKRLTKGGRDLWLQASYNPVFDSNRKVVRILKFATDVTARVRAVEAIAAGLTKLAENDLACGIDEPFHPTFEQIRVNFNGSVAVIRRALQTIEDRSSTIRSGTVEISTAAEDLSRRTEQQAASLEETAAALDEITTTVRRTAEGSRHTRTVVNTAKQNAETSRTVVSRAVEAMDGIARSSREIGQIIGVIDEIAFQTNLLALNAGVEAARAGEAGRGFAVVASEVRALAQRSAEAAKEIKGLILTSGRQVEDGVALVGQAGEALTLIATQVAEIDGIVGEIASSAHEQATALAEVNTAVNQMDQVTQQNAAMVEETTAASLALAQEAVELTRLVGQFHLGAGVVPARLADSTLRQHGRRSLAAPGPALRSVGRGGALRKAEPEAQSEWEDF